MVPRRRPSRDGVDFVAAVEQGPEAMAADEAGGAG